MRLFALFRQILEPERSTFTWSQFTECCSQALTNGYMWNYFNTNCKMMETSTPQHHFGRRSAFNLSVVSVSSPLRRRNVGVVAALEPTNDEQERSNRRSIVAIQRRLTNIGSNSSSLLDTDTVIDENNIKDHLRICAKLYTENRISAKNAWQLHVIDVMRRIALTDNANVLQVAGSSLDIGAKVYGLRVDDVHAKGLQLASSMAKTNEKQLTQEDNEEVGLEISMNQQQRRRNVKKRVKKLAADKRNTIDKEEKTLYAPVKHVESVVFATKENIDVSAADNLFTHKIPVDPASHQFMLLTETKYWLRTYDKILDNGEKLIDTEVPQITDYDLCKPFKEFETGTWDLDEEEKLLAETTDLPEAVLDENGVPIAELDGSVCDIFEDNNENPSTDVEDHEEVFQAQIHGEIAHILDAVPEENRVESDYGYNTLVKTLSGKYIDKIWAGPSHWKVKFNRRSSARYSGNTVHQVVKHVRKNKVQEKIDFSQCNVIFETVKKYKVKRAPGISTFEKITLPVPELEFSSQSFHKSINELLIKPGVPRPRLNNTINKQHDYEVQVYNYQNPNDSQYCSQHNSVGDNDEPAQHSFEEEGPIAAQQQFLDENLINAPETVSSTHIPYALQAKKIDMKKLKSAVWKCLTQSFGDYQNKIEGKIKSTQFSELYHTLPHLLTTDMKKELTCPLTLVALLHLCNENNLELQQDNYKDFTIVQANE